jgi:uncharacterized protein (UPF0332 family)
MADFDWTELVTLANACRDLAASASDGQKEAWLRTAVSRAYYSVYHQAYRKLLAEREPWIVYDHGLSTRDDVEKNEGLSMLGLDSRTVSEEFKRRVGSVHVFVAKKFKDSSGNLTRKNIGLDLFELKSERQEADYDETIEVSDAWVESVIKKATKTALQIRNLK